jgi:hypothetical protein
MLPACSLTRCNAGINIAIKIAIMAITTSSSISVKPFIRVIVFSDEFQLSAANPLKTTRFHYLTLCHFRQSVKPISFVFFTNILLAQLFCWLKSLFKTGQPSL